MDSNIFRFDFICSFPNFTQTHRGMETIEDGQRHCYMSDDSPCPESE